MAVQNALVQVSLKGAAATAVTTSGPCPVLNQTQTFQMRRFVTVL
jgi:hypothetical protein